MVFAEVKTPEQELAELRDEFAEYVIRQESVRFKAFLFGVATGAIPFAIPLLAWLTK